MSSGDEHLEFASSSSENESESQNESESNSSSESEEESHESPPPSPKKRYHSEPITLLSPVKKRVSPRDLSGKAVGKLVHHNIEQHESHIHHYSNAAAGVSSSPSRGAGKHRTLQTPTPRSSSKRETKTFEDKTFGKIKIDPSHINRLSKLSPRYDTIIDKSQHDEEEEEKPKKRSSSSKKNKSKDKKKKKSKSHSHDIVDRLDESGDEDVNHDDLDTPVILKDAIFDDSSELDTDSSSDEWKKFRGKLAKYRKQKPPPLSISAEMGEKYKKPTHREEQRAKAKFKKQIATDYKNGNVPPSIKPDLSDLQDVDHNIKMAARYNLEDELKKALIDKELLFVPPAYSVDIEILEKLKCFSIQAIKCHMDETSSKSLRYRLWRITHEFEKICS